MDKKKIKIGIIGCGIIGNALIDWINNNNPNCKILKIDPPKGYNDNLNEADIIFISIHIPTIENNKQDLSILESIIPNCPNVPIYIRTTLLPGTCDMLSEKFEKDINFMPEFLTERSAINDFNEQPMIFTNNTQLLSKIFVGKKYIEMTSLEAEITKYAPNVFGALKVTFFNGIYEYCEKHFANYNKVRNGVLLSGYINEPHTMVPGPDGNFGYGGKCFPKDVNAFISVLEGHPLQEMIKLIAKLNERYRIHEDINNA